MVIHRRMPENPGVYGRLYATTKAKRVPDLLKMVQLEFNRVRRVESIIEDGMGKCCTCGKRVHFLAGDAGHFISRRKSVTRFMDMNVHLQCKRCNNWESGRTADYEKFLVEKYGQSEVDHLIRLGNMNESYTKEDCFALLHEFRGKWRELVTEKGLRVTW